MHWQSQPFTLKCQFVVLNSLGPPGARNITENARSMMWSHQATGQEPLALRTPPQVSLTLTPPRASPIFSPGWESAGVAKSRSSCRSAQKDFQKNSLTTCFQCIHGRWPSWAHIHSDRQSGGFVNGVCFLMAHLFTCITGGGKVKLSYMIDTYLNHDQVSMLFLSTQQLRGRHKEKTLGFRILLDDFVYNFRRTCRADWTIFFWENLCYIDIYIWYTYLCLCLQTSTSIWHWTIPSSFNENEYRCQQIHPWQVTLQVVLHASAVAPTRINGEHLKQEVVWAGSRPESRKGKGNAKHDTTHGESDSDDEIDFEGCLTQWEHDVYMKYRQIYPGSVYSLNQNPDSRATCAKQSASWRDTLTRTHVWIIL